MPLHNLISSFHNIFSIFRNHGRKKYAVRFIDKLQEWKIVNKALRCSTFSWMNTFLLVDRIAQRGAQYYPYLNHQVSRLHIQENELPNGDNTVQQLGSIYIQDVGLFFTLHFSAKLTVKVWRLCNEKLPWTFVVIYF